MALCRHTICPDPRFIVWKMSPVAVAAVLNNNMRRATSGLIRKPTAAATTALTQSRNLEVMSFYWLASWSMCWQWHFYTFFPVLIMDVVKPSGTVNKMPLFHGFQEKRIEMKLQRALDETVTTWSTDLDNAAIDDAIARTF